MKKSLRLQTLRRENAELRKQLHASRPQTGAEPVRRDVASSTTTSNTKTSPREARDAYAYADARDAYFKAPPGHVLSPRWEGLSVGFHAGMGFGNWSSSAEINASNVGAVYSTPPTESAALGALAGIQFAYTWQLGSFVFGPEADLSIAAIKNADVRPYFVSFPPNPTVFGPFNTDNRMSVDWLSSVRGKLGFANGNWLFFGSGGLALAGFEASRFLSQTLSDVAVGYAVGGGVSYAFGPNVSMRAEYLRYAFPDKTLPVGNVDYATTTTVNVTNNVIRAGLDWRFN